ncbi:hypothetical protein LZD49_34705 [Dyadobacter sp. CY261]|uniref:hypothetical protein n=1 Tax=Dyadobacter sp. CY261 TaxID=2907203 RepID=UPI001F481926|nr:hypothetical protein [Dyadobacter sp. CY261]MCF0075675.1 hypothetical protein [Dyadobacter sp. CY261]
MLKTKMLLLLPAFWACLFDETITIVKQRAEYWSGNLNAANEGNPVGAAFMKYHVSGIFIISAAWPILIAIIGYYLPDRLLKIFVLFIVMIHTWGASTWISHYYGFWFVIIFVAANSVLFIKMEEIYSERIHDPSLTYKNKV